MEKRSRTTNKRLDKSVLVKAACMRVIKQIKINFPNADIAVWTGTQSQKLTSLITSNFVFDEALEILEQDKENLNDQWNRVFND